MAPSAISPPASPTLLVSSPAPLLDTLSPTTKYTDWRKDLQQKGFAVVKNAIPHDRALGYQQKAFEWLKSFGNDKLDFENPETWIKENLPKQSKINTFSSYGVAHEKFMWDARMEPGVIDAFAKLWGTDKLLVSFDSLNVTFPNRKDIPKKEPWEHIDQSPLRRGIHCIQGIINLSKSGPEDGGLLVYPGSHALNDEFFDTQTDKDTWVKKDVYLYSKEQLSWFTNKHNIQPQKVCADVGDLILWDSRTIHYGAEPTVNSNTIRTVIYAAFAPADLASPEMLKLKAEAFEKRSGTSHWPHDNILVRSTETYLDDGTRDPRDRDQPLQLPELSDKLLKLAGVKAY